MQLRSSGKSNFKLLHESSVEAAENKVWDKSFQSALTLLPRRDLVYVFEAVESAAVASKSAV